MKASATKGRDHQRLIFFQPTDTLALGIYEAYSACEQTTFRDCRIAGKLTVACALSDGAF